jgi:hypothetical protein
VCSWLKRSRITAPNVLPNDPGSFWRWFVANEALLQKQFRAGFAANQAEMPALDLIRYALEQYDDRIFLEIGLGKENKIDLIFTADGHLDRFPSVIWLVGGAPESAAFSFFAFRQRAKDFRLSMHGHDIAPTDCYYDISESQNVDGRFVISIYVDAPKIEDDEL